MKKKRKRSCVVLFIKKKILPRHKAHSMSSEECCVGKKMSISMKRKILILISLQSACDKFHLFMSERSLNIYTFRFIYIHDDDDDDA